MGFKTIKSIKYFAIIFYFLKVNFVSYSQVVLNEVMVNPSGNQGLVVFNGNSGNEYIELYNKGCTPIDVSGYFIACRQDVAGLQTGGSFRIPNISAAIIQPNSHLVLGTSTSSANSASVDIKLPDYTSNYCLNNSTRNFILANFDGWVCLYDASGTPVDAIYWSSAQGNISQSSDYGGNPCVPTGSPGGVTLESAQQINSNFSGVMAYIGNTPSSALTVSRIPDGGNWTRNIAASINNTTVGNCNGGNCNTITTFALNPTVNQPTCGSNNGSISFAPSPSGSYTYTWNPNVSTGNSASNLQANTYNITINGGGCEKDTSITLTASGSVTPSVAINSSQNNICSGVNVSFTATPTNGGTSPSYQWKLNGNNVGTNSATYSNNSLNNGDVITVTMTSNDACASPTTANSNSVTMVVTNSVTPAVSITATEDTICVGTNVTFTATGSNGGTTPTYQWQLNGNNVGSNSSTYTNSGLSNGDQIRVLFTSNASCATTSTANSNAVTMVVTNTITPAVSISATEDTICVGTNVTFTATGSNGGTTPTYQWQLNGNNVGSNSSTYTNSGLSNGDQIRVVFTSNASCATTSTANSNAVTMVVTNTITPAVSISATEDTICVGTNVTFTATGSNGGTTPTYQWQLNGNNVGSNSSTYTNSGLSNGDQIRVVFTSNASCATTSTANSNSVTIVVNDCNNIVSNLIVSKNKICINECVNFQDNSTGNIIAWRWEFEGGIPNNSTDKNPLNICYSNAGTYKVKLVVNNSSKADSVEKINYITVLDKPSIVINGNNIITKCETSLLEADKNIGSFKWSPNVGLECDTCQKTIVSPLQNTTYILSYTDENGCKNSDSIEVAVKNAVDYFIPTAFSPNNDGENDKLCIYGRCISNFTFSVYSRWGEKVFETDDINNCWDGKFKGIEMNPGVFVYTFKATLNSGEIKEEKGNVTLVK
jgi:gliding motility-associated-like protein